MDFIDLYRTTISINRKTEEKQFISKYIRSCGDETSINIEVNNDQYYFIRARVYPYPLLAQLIDLSTDQR